MYESRHLNPPIQYITLFGSQQNFYHFDIIYMFNSILSSGREWNILDQLLPASISGNQHGSEGKSKIVLTRPPLMYIPAWRLPPQRFNTSNFKFKFNWKSRRYKCYSTNAFYKLQLTIESGWKKQKTIINRKEKSVIRGINSVLTVSVKGKKKKKRLWPLVNHVLSTW